MKKIIDGKLYDTETSELILTFRRKRKSAFRNLYYWVEAELYRTKNGNYFELVGVEIGQKLEVNKLTEREAKNIIALDPDKFMGMFPDEIEEA